MQNDHEKQSYVKILTSDFCLTVEFWTWVLRNHFKTVLLGNILYFLGNMVYFQGLVA